MTFRIAKTKKSSLGRLVGAFIRDENGSTALEYGLIAAIITIALIGSLVTLRQGLMDSLYSPVVAGALEATNS